jgi:hypothetical protein
VLASRSDLFIRYCRYGDRLNIGVKARLKPTQFARFCKDAIPFTTPTEPGGPSFRPVDVDIVFKCVIIQQVMHEERKKSEQDALEVKLKVVNVGMLPETYGAFFFAGVTEPAHSSLLAASVRLRAG